jgi:hypothetical protein
MDNQNRNRDLKQGGATGVGSQPQRLGSQSDAKGGSNER